MNEVKRKNSNKKVQTYLFCNEPLILKEMVGLLYYSVYDLSVKMNAEFIINIWFFSFSVW